MRWHLELLSGDEAGSSEMCTKEGRRSREGSEYRLDRNSLWRKQEREAGERLPLATCRLHTGSGLGVSPGQVTFKHLIN